MSFGYYQNQKEEENLLDVQMRFTILHIFFCSHSFRSIIVKDLASLRESGTMKPILSTLLNVAVMDWGAVNDAQWISDNSAVPH